VNTYLCEAALARYLYRNLIARNILLDASGHIRLADFGFTKLATHS
jgi:serine/threonine protein kinase